jgi:hypothetical protein
MPLAMIGIAVHTHSVVCSKLELPGSPHREQLGVGWEGISGVVSRPSSRCCDVEPCSGIMQRANTAIVYNGRMAKQEGRNGPLILRQDVGRNRKKRRE